MHLLSCLEDLVLCTRFDAIISTSYSRNLQSPKFTKQDKRTIKLHHKYYFNHCNKKSIFLAVLASFIFWWWYHSIWLHGFVAFDRNDAERLNPLPNHRSRQKHSLITWATNESAISANKKITLSINARKFVLYKKYHLCEKLMYRKKR